MAQGITDFLASAGAAGAVGLISLVCAVGLALGRLRVGGVRLGVTFVFFAGIAAGAIGLRADGAVLQYAESFGLVVFVYVLGLRVGPGFVSAFRHGGAVLGALGLGLVALGTAFALLPVWTGHLGLGEAVGVLCGATTNTPALAAAQQEFAALGSPEGGLEAALALAVTYPLGLVGVIAVLALVRLLPGVARRDADGRTEDEAFIASFRVTNPEIFGKTMRDVAAAGGRAFVASRVWRAGRVILPTGSTPLRQGDRLLVITRPNRVARLTELFGERDTTDWMKEDIDWNALDGNLVSERVLVTRKDINGKHLGRLHLRERFGVNVCRVKRGGMQLVATPDLVLRFGDRLTVVGGREGCAKVAAELGNAIGALDEPNMITIFIGMVLGLALGYLPVALPGMGAPLRLGLAGGPMVVGILIGALGPRLHMVTYVTTSASRLISSLGLSTYLACLGLEAGPHFLETVVRPAALGWIGYGALLTALPVLLVAAVSLWLCRKPFAVTAGMLCGAMANPIALEYVNDTLPGDKASVAYAAVYPVCMFARVLLAQLIVMFCLT